MALTLTAIWRTAFLGAAFVTGMAHADLLVSPQRVILSDDHRQVVISLNNPGTTTNSYRLSWVERRETETGQLISVKAGEASRSAAELVRYSPQRVTVAPGSTQTVRLDFRPPVDLAPGEYHSHLLVGMEAPVNGTGGTPTISGEQKGISFQLNALLSYAVPVFVRHGAGTATAEISAIEPTQVKRDGVDVPGLKVRLKRGGEFSSYGRIVVYQQLDANAPVELISEAGGVAMYAEIKGLTRVVDLKPGSRLVQGSWIRVTYEGEGTDHGQVYAERSFQVGK